MHTMEYYSIFKEEDSDTGCNKHESWGQYSKLIKPVEKKTNIIWFLKIPQNSSKYPLHKYLLVKWHFQDLLGRVIMATQRTLKGLESITLFKMSISSSRLPGSICLSIHTELYFVVPPFLHFLSLYPSFVLYIF